MINCIICTLCISGCARPQYRKDEKLFYAIENNNYQGVKECLHNKKIDLEKLPFGETSAFATTDYRALGLALDLDDENHKIAQMIIKAGADVNSVDSGPTYLQEMIGQMDLKMVKSLLKAGADPNKKGKSGYNNSPLSEFVAVVSPNQKNSEEILSLLKKEGAVADKQTLSSIFQNEWGYLHARNFFLEFNLNKKKITMSSAMRAAITGNDIELQKIIKNDGIKKK